MVRWAVVCVIWGSVLTAAVGLWLVWDMPSLDDLAAPTVRAPSITLLDAQGQTLARHGTFILEAPPLERTSPWLIKAVIATEDRRFFTHTGLDFQGLLRALLVNIQQGGYRQGGSTLTQQLAKILFLSHKKTLRRKAQEAILAFMMEAAWSKEKILTLYLNRVYLGAGYTGMAAAAQGYFGTSVDRLTLFQAATLAGLLKAPSRYQPRAHPERASKRARVVLANMVATQDISQAQADAHANTIVRTTGVGQERHLSGLDWLVERTRGYVGTPGQDIRVHTSLDLHLQALLRTIVQRHAGALDAAQVGEVAMLMTDREGRILASLGGRSASAYNRATQARRQAGSLFKIPTYVLALQSGYALQAPLIDEPIAVDDWVPRNYDDTFEGPLTVEEAFARSRNIPAIVLAHELGLEAVIEFMRRIGLTSELQPVASLPLGPFDISALEAIQLLLPIFNQGRATTPIAIHSISDIRGEILFQQQSSSAVVIEPVHRSIVQRLLRAPMLHGTARRYRDFAQRRGCMGKTATTQDHRDAWFVGGCGDVLLAVWMGNDDGSPMDRVTGSGLPLTLWADVMANLP